MAAASRFTASLSSVPPLMAALAFTLVVACGAHALLDPDTYWHIATGNWILQHLAVPHRDPFSATMAGERWIDLEWLSQVLMALAYKAGGWSGLVLLVALALALAIGLLAHELGHWLEPLPTEILALLAAFSTLPNLLARPHVIALPVMAVWAAGLVNARAESRAPRWALVPLMTLWANLHGSFAIGFVLAAALGVEAVIAAGAGRRKAAVDWSLFIGASLLAACLTPNILRGLIHPVAVMNMPASMNAISEWQSPDFHSWQPIEIWLLVALYFALARGVRLPLMRVLLLLGLLHAGLVHARYQMLLGVLGPLILAEPLGRFLRGRPATASHGFDPARLTICAGVAIAALALTVALLIHPLARTADRVTPRAALDHVAPGIARLAVFNSYDFGGYLIFRGLRPYVDGRADVHGDAFIAAYLDLLRPRKDKLEAALRDHAIAWTLLKPDDGAVAVLDALPGWQRLYADDVAVVHVRTALPQQNGIASSTPFR